MKDRISLQVEPLFQEAEAAYQASQYALAEDLYLRLAEFADQQNDWPLRLKTHYWAANCQRMQSRYQEALFTYAWLTSLPQDPESAAGLKGTPEVIYIYNAYLDLVDLGRFYPSLTLEKLHQILDQAAQFLNDINRPEWAHGLRLQRGILYRKENRLQESRQELEMALSLRRREPGGIGYTLNAHLLDLAYTLGRLWDEAGALRYYQEVWRSPSHELWSRRAAAVHIAALMRRKNDLKTAESWVREGLALALKIEGPHPRFDCYGELLEILIETDRMAEARAIGAQFWLWGRKCATIGSDYQIALSLSRLHLGCARSFLGLEMKIEKELPPTPPRGTLESFRRAHYELAVAERWLGNARPLARRLDRPAGFHAYWDELKGLAFYLRAFRAWLEQDAR